MQTLRFLNIIIQNSLPFFFKFASSSIISAFKTKAFKEHMRSGKSFVKE